MTIEGDSSDYDLLSAHAEQLAKRFKDKVMLTAEVGVRKGLGSKLIMNYIRPNYSGLHFHVGIDPYGDLIYHHYDKSKNPEKGDYDEDMLMEFKKDFAEEPRFQLYQLTDFSFMEKYYYGCEFYYDNKHYVLNDYALVHIDGPHKTTDVIREAVFFAERSAPGAVFIFDDWKKFDAPVVRSVMQSYGFKFVSNGQFKMVMEKNG